MLAKAAAFAALLSLAAPRAQTPPGPPPPLDVAVLDATPASASPAELRWHAGRDALAQGKGGDAVVHLLAALEFHPDSPPLLLDLVRALAEPDAQQLWLDRFVRAAADGKGRPKLDAAQRKVLSAFDLKAPLRLAELRSLAAAELAAAAERLKGSGRDTLGNGATARWLSTLLLELAHGAPALLRAHGPALTAALQRHAADWDAICSGLLEVAQQPEPAQQELAQRALRLLQGLLRQASFGKDLQGDRPPDLGKYSAAVAALAAPATGEPRVWTIAELQALDPAQRDEFTLNHRRWAMPGVAMSTTGRYRIETTCGHETLLGVATTVELHHQRLAAHYGADPFTNRPGTVRIVPEVAELEIEGAPFWWAGGFQGGDRTVLRFAWGDLPGLGHGLTHELTHRFDGMLRPFLGSWYGEGHAQWTAGHYARMVDEQCVEDHLDRGTCGHVYWLGYDRQDKLEQLLAGKIDDYRDNYPAGYALYAFLRGYPPKQAPKYRSALLRFEQNARAGQKDPVGYFAQTFADGKDGRPAGLPAFVAEWHEFLQGCSRWLDPKTRDDSNAWVGRYGQLGPGDHPSMVLDEPTWSWARTRAEPFFGQGHAAAAGAVLAAGGRPAAAAAAFLASLRCEGWSAGAGTSAADLLLQLGRKDAAAALQQLARLRFPAAAPPPAPVPMLVQLPRTRAYLDALAEAGRAHAASRREVAAAALFAEHERLAVQLGLPPLAEAATARPAPPVPRALGGFGFVDDSLTDFDKDRVAGLWYATPEGDLHVGREQPRSATGALDRAAHSRNVFVRAVDWLPPGDHVVRARIHCTTSYVSGALVLGHWRRDRNLRLHFDAGDYDYATGRSDRREDFGKVHLRLRGLWERDGQLPQMEPGWDHTLADASASFALELRVRGPSVLVKVDGEPVLRYTTHDGAPIEGHVGFAMSTGAIRVQQPTVQRLDLALPGQALAAVAAVGLDPQQQPLAELDDLLHMPTRGLPKSPVGTLVLWIPPAAAGDDPTAKLPVALPVLSKMLGDRVEYPQDWLLCVPDGTAAAIVEEAQGRLREFGRPTLPVLAHKVGAPFTGNPWLLFVDSLGILRAAAEVGDPGLHGRVQKWARMFRAR